MIVYHGTTTRRAERICREGFLPRKPSRRVWFAEGHGYALRRAKTQARRSHDRPVVLTCDVDLPMLRARLGTKRVMRKNGVIAVDAVVPVSVLRSTPDAGIPTSPAELAKWVSRVVGVKPHRGPPSNHPGIERLSRWVNRRLSSEPRRKLPPTELLELATRWLPECFADVRVAPDRLRAYPIAGGIDVRIESGAVEPDPREDEAARYLTDASPKRRARGLSLLADLPDPDLFDWCVMFLDDEAPSVRLAALRAMLRCEEAETDAVAPLVQSDGKRIRAAALAAMAKFSGGDAPRWFERGLKDPSPCVRVAAARLLERLDPTAHRRLFELALYDPNPDVARIARGLTAGKGFASLARRA